MNHNERLKNFLKKEAKISEFSERVKAAFYKILEEEKTTIKPSAIYFSKEADETYLPILRYYADEDCSSIRKYIPDITLKIPVKMIPIARRVFLKEAAKTNEEHAVWCASSNSSMLLYSKIESVLDMEFLRFENYFLPWKVEKSAPMTPILAKEMDVFFEDNNLILVCDFGAVSISKESWNQLPELQKMFIRNSLLIKKCKFNKIVWENIFEEKY